MPNCSARRTGCPPIRCSPQISSTASGSGLDPDISVEAALLQVNRVVNARRALGGKNAAITPGKVKALIAQDTQARDLAILGEPRVNALELNLALDVTYGPPTARH